jgi:hypothetical protein
MLKSCLLKPGMKHRLALAFSPRSAVLQVLLLLSRLLLLPIEDIIVVMTFQCPNRPLVANCL